MTREDLFLAIGGADDAWVQAAETPPCAAKKRRWPLAAAVVALLALLVACGVQQGWLQFLRPDEWRGEAASAQKGYRISGTGEAAEETVENEIVLDGQKMVFQSKLLTEEGFARQAAANGWALNWTAAGNWGNFSASQTPCWDAAQLRADPAPGGGTALSGPALELPYTLVGTWSQPHRALSVSFSLADGAQEKKFPVSEDAELTQLKTKKWNDAVLVSDEPTFGGDTHVAMAWRPLDKTVSNAVGPQDALENPPAAHSFDRCLLTVYFEGMERDEALALAQALLQEE